MTKVAVQLLYFVILIAVEHIPHLMIGLVPEGSQCVRTLIKMFGEHLPDTREVVDISIQELLVPIICDLFPRLKFHIMTIEYTTITVMIYVQFTSN